MNDGIEIRVVDAFSAEPFAGNPAAVCLLDQARDDDWMQSVAREMNLSETAFLTGEAERHRIRWFTPATEVVLCGHATLASAHVLWETGRLAAGRDAVFDSRSGELRACRVGEAIELDFPVYSGEEREAPARIREALGVEPELTSRFDRPAGDDEIWLVELTTEEDVRATAPRFELMRERGTPSVIVTARADEDAVDFVSRYFAPGFGIDEDPVTGSSFCALGPYWSSRLGKTHLEGHQVSARGGRVGIDVRGHRVGISGRAVTVLEGRLRC